MTSLSVHFNKTIQNLIKGQDLFSKKWNGINYHLYREITFKRLQKIIATSEINTFDIVKDPTHFIGIMNTLHAFDMSLAIKTGVNFGLFGAGLLRLGAFEQVKDIVAKLNAGEIFGCLAITELGHGSNLNRLETVAEWNPEINYFVLRSPTQSSIKSWIGNAACHANYAIVFAQLMYKGQSKGLHPFLVRLRENGQICGGIKIVDNDYKKGLNGVDNGMITFSNVFLEKSALLSNFGYIDQMGEYKSSHATENKRFSELLSTLSGGRAVLASGANIIALKALLIAGNYSQSRLQFAGKDGIERPIINYTSHILSLGPLLAKTIVLNDTFKIVARKVVAEFATTGIVTKKMHALTSGYKIICSENAEQCCRSARLLCGGNGYSWVNEIVKMHVDVDIYQTFEGDNTLLRQEICKHKLKCLQEYVTAFEYSQILYLIRMKLQQYLEPFYVDKNYNNPNSILKILKNREKHLTLELVQSLDIQLQKNLEVFDAWNNVLDRVLEIANIYIYNKIYQCYIENFSEQGHLQKCIGILFGVELLLVVCPEDSTKLKELRKYYSRIVCDNFDKIKALLNIDSIFTNVPMINAKL